MAKQTRRTKSVNQIAKAATGKAKPTAPERLIEFCEDEGIVINPQPVLVQSKDTGFWSVQVQLAVTYREDKL